MNTNDEKLRLLREQALAAAGLPQFPASVVEELEKRLQRQPYERWKRAKARLRSAWERVIAPWTTERLDPVPNPRPCDVPRDLVTYSLLRRAVQAMGGLSSIQMEQTRQTVLLWASLRTIAQSLGEDFRLELPAESQAPSDGAKIDIAELYKLLKLSEPPDGGAEKKT